MIAGIVSEYNPFHNGHLYHISKVKAAGASAVVCVMSGNFVQRGECALVDKWSRAETAIKCGADVVIDLPTPWAVSSAETFARGGVGLLLNFGIDMLSFGCEIQSKEALLKCKNALSDKNTGEKIKQYMASGLTYPKSLGLSVSELFDNETAEALFLPNSVLALEYLKALDSSKKKIDFFPVERVGTFHDSEKAEKNFASASFIRGRSSFKDSADFLPEEMYRLLLEKESEGHIARMKNGERMILSSLREIKKEEYSLYVSDENGLAKRIYESVKTAKSLARLYENVKVKNYTHSRIRREVLMLYLRCKKDMSFGVPPYMKILAVSEKGLSLLKNAKENSSVPIITRHSQTAALGEKAKEVYGFECAATDKFALFSKNIRECAIEETHSLSVVK